MGLVPEVVSEPLRICRLLAFLCPALLAPLMASADALADTIYLKNGRVIDGKIVEQDETSVTIEVPAHTNPIQAKLGAPIRNVILRKQIDRIVLNEVSPFDPQQTVRHAPPRKGLGPLLRTLPIRWVEQWDHVADNSSLPGIVFLVAVCLVTLILLPAVFLLAGSTIIGVSDPTYSRSLLCIVLLAAYSVGFAWAVNAAGWLNTLVLYRETTAHLSIVIPLFLAGQLGIYKWVYVSSWGKAFGLVLIGLLVALITGAGFLVLLTILAS